MTSIRDALVRLRRNTARYGGCAVGRAQQVEVRVEFGMTAKQVGREKLQSRGGKLPAMICEAVEQCQA